MDTYAKLKELEERVEALETVISDKTTEPVEWIAVPEVEEGLNEAGLPRAVIYDEVVEETEMDLYEEALEEVADEYEADTENAEPEGADEDDGPAHNTHSTYNK
jgi:hypothetical protein